MTARCTLYMGALKIFGVSLSTQAATFLEIFNGLCSHLYCECAYKIWNS